MAETQMLRSTIKVTREYFHADGKTEKNVETTESMTEVFVPRDLTCTLGTPLDEYNPFPNCQCDKCDFEHCYGCEEGKGESVDCGDCAECCECNRCDHKDVCEEAFSCPASYTYEDLEDSCDGNCIACEDMSCRTYQVGTGCASKDCVGNCHTCGTTAPKVDPMTQGGVHDVREALKAVSDDVKKGSITNQSKVVIEKVSPAGTVLKVVELPMVPQEVATVIEDLIKKALGEEPNKG